MTRARELADQHKTLDVDGGTIKLDGNYPVGTGNVALGDTALDTVTSGSYNTAIGDLSLTSNASSNSNTAIGAWSLKDTTGASNTAIGAFSTYQNTTGTSNTAVGASALQSNTTASSNTAVGYQAAYDNTTGGSNVMLGRRAGYTNTTANFNTIIGEQAGYFNSTGNYNTFVGHYAGGETLGASNTFIGINSGYRVSTGTKNTILGSYNGNQGGLDIRTSSNNIVLSDGDGNPRQYYNSGTWFIPAYVGEAAADTRFKINVGNQSDWAMVLDHALVANQYFISFRHLTTQIGSIIGSSTSTAFNTSSDYRLKENVADLTGAADRVQQLAPKRFNFIADADKTVDGFLAHEVADIVPEAITGEKDAVDADGNPEYQGIDQSKLVPLLTAALQEALTKIDQLETRIAALEAN